MLISAVCAATFMASANVVPAAASPLVSPPRLEAKQSLIQVGNRCRRCYRHNSNRHHRNRHYSNRYYKNRRYNYRRHNNRKYYNYGWWGVPGGVFFGGAFVGSTLYQPYYRSYANDHVAWCYRRYRSYRASDNTFQPYHGPRRPCLSPYGR
jgi:hypothetical protein